MSFTFPCPHCQQQLEAEDELIGQTLECPSCGKPITVKKEQEKAVLPNIINDYVREKCSKMSIFASNVFHNYRAKIVSNKTFHEHRRIICAGTITFIILLGVVICHSFTGGSKKAISNVLEKNRQIEKEARPFNDGSINGLLKYIEFVYFHMIEIDLKGCPDDFIVVFRKHCSALRDKYDTCVEIQKFRDRHMSYSGMFEAVANAYLRNGRNDLYVQKLEKIDSMNNQADKDISSTYLEVLDLASKYNVNTRKFK